MDDVERKIPTPLSRAFLGQFDFWFDGPRPSLEEEASRCVRLFATGANLGTGKQPRIRAQHELPKGVFH